MKAHRPKLMLVGLCLALLNENASSAELDAINMSLDQLLQVRIISAPKFAENPDAIPSVVSILSREDIRLYGWRTLADALRSLQGFNVTDDHTYQYAGVRGISPPGDYRPRLQVLIDGISVIENIYASALIDSALPLDLDLVERIEVVRGPSASVYGGDAMFGVINVVTRGGSSLAGSEAALGLGSGAARRLRLSWGGTLNGADVMVSASGFDSDGRSLRFDDPDTGGVRTGHGVGGEDGEQLFLRARGSDWRFTLIHGRRDRNVPDSSFGTLFDDPAHRESDQLSVAEFARDMRLSPDTRLFQRGYAGAYRYQGTFPYDYSDQAPGLVVLNRDRVRGNWLGYEGRLVMQARNDQVWTLGLEYRLDNRRQQINEDVGYGCYGAGPGPCLDSDHRRQQSTLYLQDEIHLGWADTLTAGLRYDRVSDQGGFWNPRLGYAHQTERFGLFKLLLATGFRTPSAYELYYTTPTLDYGNPNLESEAIRSLELSWEMRLGDQARFTTALYGFRVLDQIGTDANLAANGSTVKATGLELEYERRWSNRARVRLGYSTQYAASADGDLDNSPRHMVKLNTAFPLGPEGLMAGLEGQWVGSRRADAGNARVGAHVLTNLNLNYAPPGQHWEASLGLYNLFDQDFSDPTNHDDQGGTSPQPGRSVQIKATFRF